MEPDLSKLSPRAKKAVMAGGPADAPVRALVELAPGASPESLEAPVESLGGVVRSWSEASHVLTLSLPSAQLPALARERDVVYVETGGAWANPHDPEDAASAHDAASDDPSAPSPDGVGP